MKDRSLKEEVRYIEYSLNEGKIESVPIVLHEDIQEPYVTYDISKIGQLQAKIPDGNLSTMLSEHLKEKHNCMIEIKTDEDHSFCTSIEVDNKLNTIMITLDRKKQI
ncbi:hypothetical protein [Bacillus subtilis]|uniref:hypothetical protein n=1 Tax=Bacillus subtilis TaxID=1423 RepID=UPI000DE58F6D|nr:hypothetical protein [Bacillus subtilis]MDI6587209.1 hypothetical protein [Bacillus subtilis]MDM5457984.1 hypothetical protein [Bacillus subtilis]QGI05128.1 hypothetical protein GII78_11270 [Bacillus subtilis]